MEGIMIDRYGPAGQALGLRQVMDRLLEDAFVSPARGASQPGSAGGPALNVYEEGDHLVVETQLPGMKAEDIDVNIEQGVLTIQGETRAEEERKERNYLIREHRTGRFSRSVRLPETVDPNAVEAIYEDGVLRLTLGKAERAKAHRIRIGTSTQGAIVGGQPTHGGSSGRSKQ
jgi:HSP20 family protein